MSSSKSFSMTKVLKEIYLGLILLFLYLPIGTLMVLSFNQLIVMAIGKFILTPCS